MIAELACAVQPSVVSLVLRKLALGIEGATAAAIMATHQTPMRVPSLSTPQPPLRRPILGANLICRGCDERPSGAGRTGLSPSSRSRCAASAGPDVDYRKPVLPAARWSKNST